MLAIARKQLRSIAMLAVAAALVVGGVAAAQSNSNGGSSDGKPGADGGLRLQVGGTAPGGMVPPPPPGAAGVPPSQIKGAQEGAETRAQAGPQLSLGDAGGEGAPVLVLPLGQATRALPDSAASALRSGGTTDGTAEIDGRSQIYAARRVGRSVVVVTRPDVVSGDDFSRYLSALLIASGVAALLAAAVAALLSRRLTQPLRRLGAAAGARSRCRSRARPSSTS